ncbi:hypothetical protein U9M48_005572 [Paspalum notatum var. saurae]|uniref:Uncharacterized protein n=1 Tax=Paspalum notatum var. saurae TaxID=547442 RepID=A0AAQ3SLV5_PASNO
MITAAGSHRRRLRHPTSTTSRRAALSAIGRPQLSRAGGFVSAVRAAATGRLHHLRRLILGRLGGRPRGCASAAASTWRRLLIMIAGDDGELAVAAAPSCRTTPTNGGADDTASESRPHAIYINQTTSCCETPGSELAISHAAGRLHLSSAAPSGLERIVDSPKGCASTAPSSRPPSAKHLPQAKLLPSSTTAAWTEVLRRPRPCPPASATGAAVRNPRRPSVIPSRASNPCAGRTSRASTPSGPSSPSP